MIKNIDSLQYVATVTGKPVVAIHNKSEDVWYFYLVDDFRPSNPSNHIHDNTLVGKNIMPLLTSITGYAHGVTTSSDTALLTKVEELPLTRAVFSCDFRWIKITG